MRVQDWRIRQIANALNGSTALGVLVAKAGGARLRRGDRGLLLAEGYRWRVPVAAAFTIGDVVATQGTFSSLADGLPDCLAHEERHADQYALAMGLPFFPLYAAGAAWSWLRTGHPGSANPFEVHAGLTAGGYCERPRDNAGLRRVASGVRSRAAWRALADGLRGASGRVRGSSEP